MGRKSKKSMANKLAKMSDEERAKYIQRKADAEEEVKRRREQLISTFIKNKLKKEEGYCRLNLAKINQHWHQLLRKQKCKQMKEEVGHLKRWIGRVYKLKDTTINNLIEELEKAEDQLQNNFQAHVIRMDELIDKHNEYLKKMHSNYEKERDELIETFLNEDRNDAEKSLERIEFLKCLVYGNDEKLKEIMIENKEKHVEKLTNIIADYHIEHEDMERNLKSICCSMAKQLSNIAKKSFKETAPKRVHYQGLLKFDHESTITIKKQYERILQKEEFLNRIEKHYSEIKSTRQKQLQVDELKLNFFKNCLSVMRKRILSDVKLDERRRILLTDCSSNVIKCLEVIVYKGEQILKLTQTCENLETQSDKMSRWLRLFQPEETSDHFGKRGDSHDNDDLYVGSEIESEQKVINEDECYFQRINMHHSPLRKKESNLRKFYELNISTYAKMSPSSTKSESTIATILSSTTRSPSISLVPTDKVYETAHKQDLLISGRSYSDTRSKSIVTRSESFTCTTLNRPKIVRPKKSNSAPASLINRKTTEINKNQNKFYETSPSVIRVLDDFKSLEGMENFWTVFNEIEVEYIDLKTEKDILLEENKSLKDKLKFLFQAHEISPHASASAVSRESVPLIFT